MRLNVTAFSAVCWLALSFQFAQASTASLVSIKTPRGVTQKFILIKPENPVAAVILFAGGKGALGLKSASGMGWGAGNFLVRTREKFAGHDLMVAVIDAPSDRGDGMNAIFRMSKAHADDIAAVAAYLKKEKDVTVWVVGTSMGTFSAANGAIGAKYRRIGPDVDHHQVEARLEDRVQPSGRGWQHGAGQSHGAHAHRFAQEGWLRYHARLGRAEIAVTPDQSREGRNRPARRR
jgi:hypothetical protein